MRSHNHGESFKDKEKLNNVHRQPNNKDSIQYFILRYEEHLIGFITSYIWRNKTKISTVLLFRAVRSKRLGATIMKLITVVTKLMWGNLSNSAWHEICVSLLFFSQGISEKGRNAKMEQKLIGIILLYRWLPNGLNIKHHMQNLDTKFMQWKFSEKALVDENSVKLLFEKKQCYLPSHLSEVDPPDGSLDVYQLLNIHLKVRQVQHK
jgi:hypothetical protein